MIILGLAVLAGIAVIVLGTLLVVFGTMRKSRWGINPVSSIECPGCHRVGGPIRRPRNVRQFLWGGGTCPHCGLEVDKWNRPIVENPTAQNR